MLAIISSSSWVEATTSQQQHDSISFIFLLLFYSFHSLSQEMAIKFTDFNLEPPPTDPVSSLNFSPFDDDSHSSPSYNLLISSWDNHLRLYTFTLHQQEEDQNQQQPSSCEIKNDFLAEAPILDSCWINQDLVASGGVDRRVRM